MNALCGTMWLTHAGTCGHVLFWCSNGRLALVDLGWQIIGHRYANTNRHISKPHNAVLSTAAHSGQIFCPLCPFWPHLAAFGQLLATSFAHCRPLLLSLLGHFCTLLPSLSTFAHFPPIFCPLSPTFLAIFRNPLSNFGHCWHVCPLLAASAESLDTFGHFWPPLVAFGHFKGGKDKKAQTKKREKNRTKSSTANHKILFGWLQPQFIQTFCGAVWICQDLFEPTLPVVQKSVVQICWYLLLEVLGGGQGGT